MSDDNYWDAHLYLWQNPGAIQRHIDFSKGNFSDKLKVIHIHNMPIKNIDLFSIPPILEELCLKGCGVTMEDIKELDMPASLKRVEVEDIGW